MFNTKRLQAHIYKFGQRISYIKRSICACRVAGQLDADPTCAYCAATGYVSEPAVEIRLMITSQDIARQYSDIGELKIGDCIATVSFDSPAYSARLDDRFVMIQVSEPFSELITVATTTSSIVLPVQYTYSTVERLANLAGPIEFAYNDATRTITTSLPVDARTQLSISGTRHPIYKLFGNLARDRGAHCDAFKLPRRMILTRETIR